MSESEGWSSTALYSAAMDSGVFPSLEYTSPSWAYHLAWVAGLPRETRIMDEQTSRASV